jgi:hypothetical protein
MGAIARNIANKITTSGVFTSGAITNASVTGITVLANATDGITLISSQTANASASISFTTGITSTYKAYKFVFVNIHPSVDDSYFQFNASTDGGSNYNVTKTTTFFRSVNSESGLETAFSYITADDLAQSTAYQTFVHGGAIGNATDENASGSITIFNPSSTTYVKHFIAQTSSTHSGDYALNNFTAGYLNTTSAVNAIRFTMASGNIDEGKIYLYGIK